MENHARVDPVSNSDPVEEKHAWLTRDLKLLVLQRLREEGFKETAHSLERESGLYLDAEHLQGLVGCGAWDDAERYLGGFAADAGDHGSPCSASRIFFAIRRQKYTEALDRHLRAEEGHVLVNAIKALAPFDEEAAKMVAALENFRQRERVDTASARNAVALEVTELIQANPLFQDKPWRSRISHRFRLPGWAR